MRLTTALQQQKLDDAAIEEEAMAVKLDAMMAFCAKIESSLIERNQEVAQCLTDMAVATAAELKAMRQMQAGLVAELRGTPEWHDGVPVTRQVPRMMPAIDEEAAEE